MFKLTNIPFIVKIPRENRTIYSIIAKRNILDIDVNGPVYQYGKKYKIVSVMNMVALYFDRLRYSTRPNGFDWFYHLEKFEMELVPLD